MLFIHNCYKLFRNGTGQALQILSSGSSILRGGGHESKTSSFGLILHQTVLFVG